MRVIGARGFFQVPAARRKRYNIHMTSSERERIMNERHQGRRKWNDTLSELGLEGESASQSPPSATPPRNAPQANEPAPIPPAPLEEEEMPAPRHRRGRRDHAPIEERVEPVEAAPVEEAAESVE